LGSFLSPRLPLPADPFVATGWQMLLGGTIMILTGLAAGEAGRLDVAAVPARGWLAIGYLVTVGSLVAFTAYVWLLGHAPLSLVSTYAYVNPVVAVLLGWAILGEQITPVIAAGGLVIVAGVALVVRGERGPRAPAGAPGRTSGLGPARESGQAGRASPVARAWSRVSRPDRQASATARKASLASGSATVTRTPSSP
jgi:hypothetical protein